MHPSNMSHVKARYMDSNTTWKSEKVEGFFFGPKFPERGAAKFFGPKFPEISWKEISDEET